MNKPDFLPLMIESFSNISGWIAYLGDREIEPDEKTDELAPLFFRRLVHLLLQKSFMVAVSSSPTEIQELLELQLIHNIAIEPKKFSEVVAALPTFLQQNPQLEATVRNVGKQSG
jgi:hypothetical protein